MLEGSGVRDEEEETWEGGWRVLRARVKKKMQAKLLEVTALKESNTRLMGLLKQLNLQC